MAFLVIYRIVKHAASSAATGFVERVLLISKSCRVICRDRFCSKGLVSHAAADSKGTSQKLNIY